ncbi:MAG: hypothetical protein KBD78_05770 [Oligoflexales bacterium]|jgi:hypothetical protein|nr:hypothetical protein [Oligoflexales bacterium]
MFDANAFKKKAKFWVESNPSGSLEEFIDFCEEMIPSGQFASNQWLLEQTVNWFRYIIKQREISNHLHGEFLD